MTILKTLLKVSLTKWRENKAAYVIYIGVFVAMTTLYLDPSNDNVPYKILGTLFLAGLLLLGFLPKKTEYAVALIIVVTGTFSAFLSPNNDIPDEPVHYQRSLFLSEGQLNLSNQTKNLKESKDFVAIDKEFQVPLLISRLQDTKPSRKEAVNRRLTVTNAYYVFGYLPQAIGLWLGNLLNISVIFSYFLGRFFNVLAYAFLAFWAVKRAGSMSQIMAVSALLPMNVYLAGSYNQDTMAIGVMLVIISMFCSFYTTDRKIRLKDLLVFSLLSMLLATMKLPFIVLIFLLFFIPKEKFDLQKISVWRGKLFAIAAVVLVTLFWLKLYSEVVNENSHEVEILREVSAKKQLLSILRQPVMYGRVLIKESLTHLLNPFKINQFGWLSYGPLFLISYNFMYLGTVVINNANKIRLNILSRLSTILLSAGLVFVVTLTLYLTWTPVGDMAVQGIQDRYFLGVIPLILIFFVSNNRFFEKFQDFLPERLILNISTCFIYTMLLSTVLNYYQF